MNVLVTGGAGFIGSHTVVELVQEGHCVTILDNFCVSFRRTHLDTCSACGSLSIVGSFGGDQAFAGRQLCGSSSSMRLWGWVGSRVSTSFR